MDLAGPSFIVPCTPSGAVDCKFHPSIPTCSMKVHASRSVSAIFSRTMTTARRRRQKDAVDSFSTWECSKGGVGEGPMVASDDEWMAFGGVSSEGEVAAPRLGTPWTALFSTYGGWMIDIDEDDG